ncbi:hypothetical protein SCP_1005540 [Sparassis crispa]|uniref:BAR-domain-containing protein n=1 Tax=Sparassis crispa TaxID=139825 RepID=A0A401GYQ9_9APHY|nr:hypothetical protein SCP_1005540 [Sparassis crispa]GBE87306.1 hypothetical protein SCP_1005540 [Sparassis crispa]
MASKQLGKLRQWAGEVISSRDRTIVTDEFRELEHDIELRRQGLWKLHVASEDCHEALRKKKISEVIEDSGKMLPIDALGVVMIQHGEEFGDDSAFGTSLVNLGRAHCKMATLQETYAMLFEENYIASLRRAEDEIKEYQVVRKKLESRRLSYDAAITKLDKVKNSKKEKEKERIEAEDECARAQSRYEETAEDVRARMHAIQDNEVSLLRELSGLLDVEINYAEQCVEVLRDVKSGWVDESTLQQMEPHRGKAGPTHSFIRSAPNEHRSNSVRSMKSLSKHAELSDESVEEPSKGIRRSLSRRKSQASSRAPSRAQSRASRKRSDSTATAASEKDRDKTDKEKEKEKADKAPRKMSVAGWASSAMSSVTALGKKDKDKDAFAALHDDAGVGHHPGDEDYADVKRSTGMYAKSKSAPATPSLSPKGVTRMPASQSMYASSRWNAAPRKVAVALYDFAAGSSDELTFRTGDQIVVVNEVLDGWWMGELGGKRGLFPRTYTEVINPPSLSVSSRPPLPQRPPVISRFGANTPSTLSLDSDDPKRGTEHVGTEEFVTSDVDDEHLFGDHNYAGVSSPLYGAFNHDGASSGGEDDEEEHLMPIRRSKDDDDSDTWQTSTSYLPPGRISEIAVKAAPAKKPPPPPPPRRSATASPSVPPVPSRHGTIRSKSSQGSSVSLVALANTPTNSVGMARMTHSPFDSPRDFQ